MSDSANDKTYSYSSESDEVLRTRAQSVAEQQETEEHDYHAYICFHAGGYIFALPNTDIREVTGLREVVPIPYTPGFVRGIAHIHGDFLSVIDILSLVSDQETNLSTSSHLIVLDSVPCPICILTDAVPYPLNVEVQQIQDMRGFVPQWLEVIMTGIVVSEGTFIGLLSKSGITYHERLLALLGLQEAGEHT